MYNLTVQIVDLFNTKVWEILDLPARYGGFLALLFVIWSALLEVSPFSIVGCSAGTVEFINLSMVRWPIHHIYYLPEKIQTPSMATPLHIFNKPIDKGGLCSPLAKAHCTSGTSWCSWGHDISAPLGWYFMWLGNSIPSSNWLPSFCWEYGHIKTLQIAPDKTTG